MSRVSSLLVIAISLYLTLIQTAGSAEPTASYAPDLGQLDNTAPARVLFVGNSYLYYNDSLHNHVRRIAAERGPLDGDAYQYKSATIGGARLSHHAIGGLLEPGKLGIEKPFELVILQGGSAEVLGDDDRAQFRESALRMSERIRGTGAEVALYMTHAYVKPHKRYSPGMTDTVAQAYVAVGNELSALVIPVGLAFERAYRERPDIQLHKSFDGSHPSLLGTYLGACVVYQSVYGHSAKSIRYDYFGTVGQDDAAFLRRVADETVREFFGRD